MQQPLKHLPLILASSSPYRRQLLSQLKVEFECVNPRINETEKSNETADQLAARLAQEKANAVASDYPTHLIIGSDQVAVLDRAMMTKPGNHDNAVAQLQQCSGKKVIFYTGLALLNSQTGQLQHSVEPFSVYFRTLTTATIERYLISEKPYDCAGSFKVEGLGITLFEKLDGNDPNSLIGLPLIQLTSMLAKEGLLRP
ncbi:MAG: Maf family protein [Oceanicoccus sp.]